MNRTFDKSLAFLLGSHFGFSKGPVTPPPRNEKRENCRPIKNQQLADFISRNEKT